MTTLPAPTLDAYFSLLDGSPSSGLPADVALSKQALHDHPFIWALDSFVFAGQDGHRATERYAQAQLMTQMMPLHVVIYRILSTANGIMHLERVL